VDIPLRAAEGALRPLLAQDVVLLGGKDLAPFTLRLDDLFQSRRLLGLDVGTHRTPV
jgi:hypothetical protein